MDSRVLEHGMFDRLKQPFLHRVTTGKWLLRSLTTPLAGVSRTATKRDNRYRGIDTRSMQSLICGVKKRRPRRVFTQLPDHHPSETMIQHIFRLLMDGERIFIGPEVVAIKQPGCA